MSATAERRGILARLAAISDGAILRAAFYAMLAGTLTVLYIDFRELTGLDPAALVAPVTPVLPAFDPDSPETGPGPVVTTPFDILDRPLEITLGTGGVLKLQGTIDPGAAARFVAEVSARGEYVKTIVIDSPGGSVADAIEIGEAIRGGGFSTSVEAGAICASSCPLAFAGGTRRRATEASAIGVHQVYAVLPGGELPAGVAAAGDAMSDAQKTTARITRHLSAMGIDPALWLHALETPPDRLYYLKPDELTAYRLVTQMAAAP